MVDAREKGNQALLVCRNVTVNGRRTSLRMEPLLWDSLKDIAERESMTIHQLCSEIDLRRGQANLTAALRVFIISYYRKAAAAAAPRGFAEEPSGDFGDSAESDLLSSALDAAIPLDDD